MKIEVDIKRAEQSWEIDSGEQRNFLIVDVLGLEVRVPCTQEQLATVLTTLHSEGPDEEDGEEEDEEDPEPVAAPSTFQTRQQEELVERPVATPSRSLPPLQRRRGDDVGIAQG